MISERDVDARSDADERRRAGPVGAVLDGMPSGSDPGGSAFLLPFTTISEGMHIGGIARGRKRASTENVCPWPVARSAVFCAHAKPGALVLISCAAGSLPPARMCPTGCAAKRDETRRDHQSFRQSGFRARSAAAQTFEQQLAASSFVRDLRRCCAERLARGTPGCP